MASRSSSWLALASLFLGFSAASFSCGEDKPRPPPLTNSGSTTSTSVTTGGGGSGGDAAGGAGGTGGSAGSMGTGGFPETCSNKEKGEDETDVDCGGSCAPCIAGKTCSVEKDCASKNCKGGVCAMESCSDFIQNGDETDVDCGGPFCGLCPATKKCAMASDCISSVCTNGVCIQESCADGVLNGTETDLDCGGPGCPGCGLNKNCVGNGDCVSKTCSAAGGQSICVCPIGTVVVPINGGGAYCMDATEVTYQEYQAFHSAGIQASTQPDACKPWNQNFTPTANWSDWAANGKGNFPVTNVNWCNAFMYCKFKGKHLCGKIGGGPNATTDHADTVKSEWFNACSAQGNNVYPYGNVFTSGTCNGETCAATLAQSDMAIKLCQGGQPMLQQMSGNAAEWEDSCDGIAGPSDTCRVRGGSFCSNADELRCDADSKKARNFADDRTGFRCCL